MKVFENIDNYILNAPNFIIPFDCMNEVYLLRKIMDKETYIEEYLQSEIDQKYKNFNHSQIPKIKKNILEILKKEEKYCVLKTTKITCKCAEVPEEMIQCDNCGNIWDGCAQCNCYLDPYY